MVHGAHRDGFPLAVRAIFDRALEDASVQTRPDDGIVRRVRDLRGVHEVMGPDVDRMRATHRQCARKLPRDRPGNQEPSDAQKYAPSKSRMFRERSGDAVAEKRAALRVTVRRHGGKRAQFFQDLGEEVARFRVSRQERQEIIGPLRDEQAGALVAVRVPADVGAAVAGNSDAATDFPPDQLRRDRMLRENRPSGIRFGLETENTPDPGTLRVIQKPPHYLRD